LHDGFGDIRLNPHLVKEPPFEIWPTVIYSQQVADDLLPFLAKYEVSVRLEIHAAQQSMHQTAGMRRVILAFL
jgi:hypothetical protein